MTNIEYIKDKNPEYILNKHVSYENTVLNEHSAIISGFKDTPAAEAYSELQGRLFIGMCLKEKADQFIEERREKYYDEEVDKLDPNQRKFVDPQRMANNRAWTRMINEALSIFINKYKIDGSKAKIAVLDYETFDGKPIVEADMVVGFTDDDKGL